MNNYAASIDNLPLWQQAIRAKCVHPTGTFIEFEKEEIDGELIMRGDKRVLIAAKDVEDETTGVQSVKVEDFDHVLDGLVRWKIVAAELIEPGSQRIVYDVQVRQ